MQTAAIEVLVAENKRSSDDEGAIKVAAIPAAAITAAAMISCSEGAMQTSATNEAAETKER